MTFESFINILFYFLSVPWPYLAPADLPPCLLPELLHGAGEVSGVGGAVVGVATVRVPGIATRLPRQLLQEDREKKGEKKEMKADLSCSIL